MALLPSRQADLFLPLIEAPDDAAQWTAFLQDLVARTEARRGMIVIAPAISGGGHAPVTIQHRAAGAGGEPPIDPEALAALGLQHLGALRPGRVYALEELFDHGDAARVVRQRDALGAQGIGFARLMRVVAGRAGEAWVVMVKSREDFAAGAAALLSAAAPLLAATLRAAAALGEARLARSLAEEALARLGIGQIALDAAGRVISADRIATETLDIRDSSAGRAGPRLALPPAASERMERCCAAFAEAERRGVPAPEPVLIMIDDRLSLLLRPASGLPAPGLFAKPAAIASLRLAAREDERRGAAVLRELYRLSPREAALAERLSRGAMIVEAGHDLRLTAETARNYSKRIYARTGARGQADLVRTILCGLAPLA